MQRTTALVYALILAIVIAIVAYYGARIRLRSVLALFFLLVIVFFFLFYPASRVTSEGADITLAVLGCLLTVGQIWLLIYLVVDIFSDIRPQEHNDTEEKMVTDAVVVDTSVIDSSSSPLQKFTAFFSKMSPAVMQRENLASETSVQTK